MFRAEGRGFMAWFLGMGLLAPVPLETATERSRQGHLMNS